jgi:pentose-5-phosphate-3-epimerase
MSETPYYDEYKRRRNLKLSQDPNTPVEVLEVLSTDEDYDVRCNVALNPNTPVEVLEVLSTDEDFVVRYWVANNPNYIKEND